ncbi:unnamed protein product, partial [Phyllotreta striolata]
HRNFPLKSNIDNLYIFLYTAYLQRFIIKRFNMEEPSLKAYSDESVLLTNFQLNVIISSAILILVPLIYKLRRVSQSETKDAGIIYNKECPICFNLFQFPIKSHCGHVYCMDCIYTYWKTLAWEASCPLCRQLLQQLQIIEIENYSKVIQKKLMKQVKEISSVQNAKLKLLSISALGYIYGILIALLWNLLLINKDKLLKWFFYVKSL